MKEIELKLYLDKKNKEKFIDNCNKSFTLVMPRTQESTIMYDNKEEFMLKSDGRLRVRTGHKNSLSYKKPITRKGIKEEIEFETEVEDVKQTELILKEVGYFPVSGYARYRTIWKKNNIKIFLDEFSFGDFVEVEGGKVEIKKIAGSLGFDIKNNITKSYDGMYKEYCKMKGIQEKPFFK